MEIVFQIGGFGERKQRPTAGQTAPVPDYAKLRGSSTEAADNKKKLEEAMNNRCVDMAERPEWTEIIAVSREVAMQVLGQRPKKSQRPWLEGREDEKKQLDEAVSQAQQRRWSATRDQSGAETASEELKQASSELKKHRKSRRQKMKEWEDKFWKDLGERATEAGWKGDSGRVFEVVRDLLDRGKNKQRDGGRHTVADVDAERKAWKEHFENISRGTGTVQDRVWDNIKKHGGQATWLEKEPSDIELDVAVSRMKIQKAPGDDQVAAEIIKYGGTELRKRVYAIVKEMWKRAANAPDGQEAAEWPEEWKIGVTVPLWKNKGARSDKNTWRGITLLSVGSKLLARVVARRTASWSEGFLCEEQNGLRNGRGPDDSLMVSRRVSEEVNRAVGEDWILMSFFDIEKAYPRVCRIGFYGS